MSTLVSAYQISKSFASKELFKKISFSIDSQQKIGLIGPNGAGKSTLLKILKQEIAPDSGQLSFSQSLRIGYLEQKTTFKDERSIYETLMSYSDDEYDSQNISLALELIKKLSLDKTIQSENTPVNQLSGGLQKRLALGCELMKKPNLLMLDEPTNHLDIQSIFWLESFIQDQTQISFLIITHDRAFLQNTCDAIFDLDPRNPEGLIKTEGSYSEHLEIKNQLLSAQQKLEEKRRNTMLIEKAWLARGPQARLTKQKARQNRAHALIEEVDQLETKNSVKKSSFSFSSTDKSPKKLIELTQVTKSYGDRLLFSNLTGLIRPGDRIGLLGKNGCGKSTLIKILMEQEAPSSGVVFVNPDIAINYFEQGKDSIDQSKTVLRVICPEGDYVHFNNQPVFARSYLSRFHFNGFQMDMPVSKLSGGEQSRLLIAKLMLTKAQVLILDEPTNDLDTDTLDVLSDCLAEFQGAIILVSHDRFFLDQNSNEIWAFTEFESKEIIKFANYHQWEDWYFQNKSQFESLLNEKSKLDSQQSHSNSKGKSTNKKLSFKEINEYQNMESLIQKKESELESLKSNLNSAEVQSNYVKISEISSQCAQLEQEILSLYQRWETLEQKIKS